jgi:four helix bundle protein
VQSAELRIISLPAAAEIFNYYMRYKMQKAIIEQKSFDFAVRIVKLYQYLCEEKKEYVLSKQLLRCGTSIGANVSESQRGQSKPDFYSKIAIALKEANETYYWIRLLYATDYLIEKQYSSLAADINEIISILVAICNSKNKTE